MLLLERCLLLLFWYCFLHGVINMKKFSDGSEIIIVLYKSLKDYRNMAKFKVTQFQ